MISLNTNHIGRCLGDHGTGSGGLVPPIGRKLTGGAVVTCETVDAGFNQNKTELGVLVLAVKGQVLTDLNGLLDKHVQILWNFGGESIGFQDTNNLLSSDRSDLCNTIAVPENHTNLGRSQTLLGKLADLVLDIRRGNLEPGRGSALVRHGTLGNTLTGSMKTTHFSVKSNARVRKTKEYI